MGNEHSTCPQSARLHVERRSLDAGVFRQVHSTHGTPRSAPAIQLDEEDNFDRNFNFAEIEQRRMSTSPSKRRMSLDVTHCRNHTRAKLSLSGREEMMCNKQRKMSRSSGTYADSATDYMMIPLAEQLKLSTYQILLLQQTWGKVKTTVFANTFRLLTQRNNLSKEMFQKMSIVEGFSSNKCCDIKEHTRLLNDLFETAILEINSPCKIIQTKCMQIGKAHYPSGGAANPRPCGQVWEDLADCLTESINKAECLRGKREPMKAWFALISYIIDNMKCGYMAEFKRRSVSRASSGYITSENV
ncbi:hypothetical protein L596_013005 [Steinernema carpocapsae]|uniref:Globin family profile domain-containing protein n=1 Tax=Steinernema carpocapsae TaxID=34508 RepID=A0A4U5NZ42_STECR|nr:hypothetical protein L596_013005 [Steinernema carpocapsae]